MRMTLMPNLWTHATPTDDDHPLAVAVEQVVRPLPLSPARKARIRDDLFSHLKSIHEEESTKGGTNEEIVARSLSRFGAPAEIATELRGDTTWGQAVGWRLSRIFDFRVSESAEKFAFRFFIYLALMMAAVLLIACPAKWLLDREFRPDEIAAVAITLGLVAVFVAAMIYFGIKFADTALNQLHRQTLELFRLVAPLRITMAFREGSELTLAALKLSVDCSPRVAMAIWLLLLTAVYPAMYFTACYLYNEAYLLTHPNWALLVPAAVGTTLVGLAAGFGFVADRSYRQHWESLPIFSKEMAT